MSKTISYYQDEKKCETACKMLLDSVTISEDAPKPNELVRDIRR